MQGDLKFDSAGVVDAPRVGPGWQGYEAVAASVLTPENRFLAAALAGRNCFLTGMAGTGKSTLLRRFIEECLHSTNIHRVDITAPTGVAALNVGGTTIHSIGHIAKLQRIADNDEEFVGPTEMLRELHGDNKAFVESLRAAHEVTSKANDYATTSLIEIWIDEAERRSWFLFEATR